VSIKWWRLRWTDTWLWFVRTTRTAAFQATLVQCGISSHAGGAKGPVLIDQSDRDSQHQKRLNFHPEHYLHYPVPFRAPKDHKLRIYQAEIRIHMFHFPLPIFSILMHYPGIAYTMKIFIHNCWLMKVHHLVSILSAVSECCEHTFWRREQPTQCTSKWKWALIERNKISVHYNLQFADTLM